MASRPPHGLPLRPPCRAPPPLPSPLRGVPGRTRAQVTRRRTALLAHSTLRLPFPTPVGCCSAPLLHGRALDARAHSSALRPSTSRCRRRPALAPVHAPHPNPNPITVQAQRLPRPAAGTPGCCRWRRARGARRRRPRPRWPRAPAAAATTWRSCARLTAGRPRAPAAGLAASARTRPRTASAAAPWPCWTACAASCWASSRRARRARARAPPAGQHTGKALCEKCDVLNRQGAAGEHARAPARGDGPARPGRGGRRGPPLRPRARRAQARGFIASLAGASRNAADAGLVRSVLAAGFYPQVRAPPRAAPVRLCIRNHLHARRGEVSHPFEPASALPCCVRAAALHVTSCVQRPHRAERGHRTWGVACREAANADADTSKCRCPLKQAAAARPQSPF